MKLQTSIMKEATGVAFVIAISGENKIRKKSKPAARADVKTPISVPVISPRAIRHSDAAVMM